MANTFEWNCGLELTGITLAYETDVDVNREGPDGRERVSEVWIHATDGHDLVRWLLAQDKLDITLEEVCDLGIRWAAKEGLDDVDRHRIEKAYMEDFVEAADNDWEGQGEPDWDAERMRKAGF